MELSPDIVFMIGLGLENGYLWISLFYFIKDKDIIRFVRELYCIVNILNGQMYKKYFFSFGSMLTIEQRETIECMGKISSLFTTKFVDNEFYLLLT